MSHRLPIALALKNRGEEVHVAANIGADDPDTAQRLLDFGIRFHRLKMSRGGAGPLELLRDLLDLVRLLKHIRPDIVHLVTIKPILLGGLAARLSSVPGAVLAIPGRGSVFSTSGLRAAVRRGLALSGYRLAYRRGVTRVILQNAEDHAYFVSNGTFLDGDTSLIRGSGVDLRRFAATEEPPGIPIVVLACRMLRQKGVAHFVGAAEIVNQGGRIARFVLVGEPDFGNPDSHTREEILDWEKKGHVEWWGFRRDIESVIAGCHIVCLPTYYGEGVPKVLIEAAACRRPIVTTNTPGCRDIVRDGFNGLLVPTGDIHSLAEALRRLISSAETRRVMGANGRLLAAREFSIDKVVQQTLDVYDDLAMNCGISA